jgi:2-polyprenyl-6-methoxyphenol hydroxylase-like FAD-dependent oxidoreductase
MTRHNGVPVVIVGAGPTGVMLAIELARRGLPVRIFDKQPKRSIETRAIGIHARTLETFHQLGIVDQFLERGHRTTGMAVHTRARRSTKVDFGRLDSPYPFVLMLGQDQTQEILDRKLEQIGVSIERGSEVVKLDHQTDRVEITITRAGEQEERLAADWVVGCDGAHSILRRHLGVSFDGDDYGQDWLMTEVNIEWPIERQRFHVFSYTATPVVAFPLPDGRWRVFLPQVPNRAGERQPPDMREIERLVAQRGPASMKLTNPTLLQAFRCYRRSTRIMRRGRLLVAGDAAHIHSPAGGQGMNTGLQDACNLGWKLALVAHGETVPELLNTYQDERVPIAAGVLGFTHTLVRLFTISSPRKRWLRDRVLPIAMSVPAAERCYTRRLSQISHSYRGGPLAPASARRRRTSILPGDRLPSVFGLQRDGKPLSTLDVLGSTAHTLLVLSGQRADEKAAVAAIAYLAPFNGTMGIVSVDQLPSTHNPHSVSDPQLRAHRRYGALRGQLLLVRPDGYLACRAPLDRPDIPERYLEQLTSQPARPQRTTGAHQASSPGLGPIPKAAG